MIEYTVKVHTNGDKYWYLNGKRHREDGPAVEWVNGYKFWYLNGKRHREDGPTVELANGDKSWYLNGVNLTEEENRKATQTPSCEGREVVVDGVTYVLKAKG